MKELRADCRKRWGIAAGTPILASGHQPELYHPGVWVKNFAINRVAKQSGSVGLNLIADHDTVKRASLTVPTWSEWRPGAIRTTAVSFGRVPPNTAWETATVEDLTAWVTFIADVRKQTEQWPKPPILLMHRWPEFTGHLGKHFTAMRRQIETRWNCCLKEQPVSDLATSPEFQQFIAAVLTDLPAFRQHYNSAIEGYRRRHKLRSQTHPMPLLAEGEAPFWCNGPHGRMPPTPETPHGDYRPRAITLTLFTRLIAADLFVHGIGGAKYDEVTDDIIRNWLGIEPPRYAVITATAQLTLPKFDVGKPQREQLQRQLRERDWQPERHAEMPAELTARKSDWIARNPGTRAGRRERFTALQAITRELREQLPPSDVALRLRETELALDANAILQNREYSWVLHDEATLRELFFPHGA